MRFLRLFAISLIVAAGACAQDRDFLTSDEADQIREAQEPNARLLLYAKFATTRVALVEQLLSKEKVGRTTLIHDTLEDYAKIIEAIDTVADDALKRKLDITIGMKEVASAEKQMLATLQKLDEAPAEGLCPLRVRPEAGDRNHAGQRGPVRAGPREPRELGRRKGKEGAEGSRGDHAPGRGGQEAPGREERGRAQKEGPTLAAQGRGSQAALTSWPDLSQTAARARALRRQQLRRHPP